MNSLATLLFQSAYLLIPAYMANMAPVIAKKLKIFKSLDVPVDNGKVWSDSKELFGRNKTYRGFLCGMIGGVIGAYLQMALYNIDFFARMSIPGIDYTNHIFVIILGILMGLGAITGDLIKSFFKRRVNIAPGSSFVPFDQIDFVVGAYIFIIPILVIYHVAISWQIISSSIIISFFLHMLINHISYYLGIRGEKW